MKITKNKNGFLLEVSREEMACVINNGLLHALEFVKEWEFQARIGCSRKRVRDMLDDVGQAYRGNIGDTTMKIAASNDGFTMDVSVEELGIFINAIHESLERIEDWEYPILMAWTKEEVRPVLADLMQAYESFMKGK